MTKATLIVTDSGAGYGDILFTLNLYRTLVATRHPIYFVVHPDHKEKVIRLEGHLEFGFDPSIMLSPDELKQHIDSKHIDVGTIIEGPVLVKGKIIQEVDAALINNPTKSVQLILMPEYAFSKRIITKETHENKRADNRKKLSNMHYDCTIFPGFNADTPTEEEKEAGIFPVRALLAPISEEDASAQLDEKIRQALLHPIADYKRNTELSMQYSHDHAFDHDSTKISSAVNFLRIHREFSKTSHKNQDVLMIGPDMVEKRKALVNIQEQLLSDGYTHISFYNADTGEEEVFYDAPSSDKPVKTYRVIYTTAMTHHSMIAANKLSGPLCGATGDQSFGEALTLSKLIIYETMRWKTHLIDDYIQTLTQLSNNDPLIVQALSLSRSLEQQNAPQELGDLLRSKHPKGGTVQDQWMLLNKKLMIQFDLPSIILKKITDWESLTKVHFAVDEQAVLATHTFESLPEATHSSGLSSSLLFSKSSNIDHLNETNINIPDKH